MLPTSSMAYLWLGFTLLVFLLLSTDVTGSDEVPQETPRSHKDLLESYWFHFMTRPDLRIPKYHIEIFDKDAIAPGYWFIAPYENINKLKRGRAWEGPLIYNGHGELIWAGMPAMDYYMVNDFRVTRYNNTDMLTAIMFRDNAGIFLNNRYEIVKSVNWTAEWEFANMHEFHVIRNGTRVLTTTRNRWTNLTLEESREMGYEGNCSLRADGVKEVDISVEPPKVLFEWVGLDHIPAKESWDRLNDKDLAKFDEICEKDWDFQHINSVDKFADGDYLISSKVLDTIFKVSHVDGSIVWRLGGKKSDFKLKSSVKFGNQHIPRIINESDTQLTISLFANSSPKRSRGIVIQLNLQDKTVKLLQEAHTLPINKTLDVNSRGSAQLLPNGNMFTCWANWARISEHDANGKLLMYSYLKRDYDNRDGNKMPTYRGYKFEWVGHPTQPPDVYSAAFSAGTENFVTRIFVSWNGATEVAKWIFYESNADGTTLKKIEDSKWSGFETGIRYEGYIRHVVVEALDSEDKAIGRSQVVKTIPPVEGSPVALNQTADVLSCDTNKAVGNTDGEFDTDYDYDGFNFNSPTYDDDDDADAAVGRLWIVQGFDPVSALVGFVTCGIMWMAKKLWGRRVSLRHKGPKYEPLGSKDSEPFFDEAEEGEDDNDIELKEQDRAHRK